MKLTAGLNFINVLPTAFTCADPKTVKKTVKLSIFFTLSGSMSIKAVRKMLVKLTPGLYQEQCFSRDKLSHFCKFILKCNLDYIVVNAAKHTFKLTIRSVKGDFTK